MFKGLSLAGPYVDMIGIGRAAMTSAMVGKRIGDLLEEGVYSDLSRVSTGLKTYNELVEEELKNI